MIYILTSGSIGAWKCWLAGWSVILKRQGRTFSEDYDRPTNPPTIGHEDPNNSLRVTLSTRAPSDNHFNLTNLYCQLQLRCHLHTSHVSAVVFPRKLSIRE